ncbi:hypothetical protein M409DRAFT_71525 [Zasmidium cellare ATCC 36951]|uniref:FAD-dependent oxidoreductase 2 FAD-binding domain-containing protein n=1 Tax=Zasmidium cellare ATCC 36951 TaxID=1080233 RepID=A0A6A6BYM9_ZASCE|nr:uncharacterized protein M409DRAFT_71525 [Zasmidium cellare ATCC 36951]KAF2158672.1 hypothetical protein M409DRAFT_71525 [Zasmidium cellare ATCC 36951]
MSNNHNFDVVVVGGGMTACIAALTAYENGARVAIVEAAPRDERGGNSRFAGTVWRFVHEGREHLKPLLDAKALERFDGAEIGPYTAATFEEDMLKKSGGRHDRDEIKTLIQRGYPTVQWLAGHGTPFELPFDLFVPRKAEKGQRVNLYPGVPVINRDNGRGLTDAVWAAVEKTNIKVFYESPAHDLIVKGNQVLGITVRRNMGFDRFYGRVILACGGFEANPRMRRQYLGEGTELAIVRGTRFNTGRMLEQSIAAGAQAQGHWGGYHCAPLDINTPKVGNFESLDAWERYAFPYCIMVNTAGQRFVDEGEDETSLIYSKIGAALAKEKDAKAFQILDQKTVKYLEPRYLSHGTRIEANTISGLAEKLGIEPSSLNKTVDDFNAAVPDESTPFHPYQKDGRCTKEGLSPKKSHWAQKIDKPPFVAYEVTVGITFTFGGIKTDQSACVMNNEGNVMPGLYAAGEMTGGFYFGYAAGASLLRSAVYARIAGEHAARRGDNRELVARL